MGKPVQKDRESISLFEEGQGKLRAWVTRANYPAVVAAIGFGVVVVGDLEVEMMYVSNNFIRLLAKGKILTGVLGRAEIMLSMLMLRLGRPEGYFE